MPARRTKRIARLLVALTGAAGIAAAASAQPDILRYEGDPVYLEPAGRGQGRIVAHIEIDHHEHHDVYRGEDPCDILLMALEHAGYHAWMDGNTIVVDTCEGTPHIHFESREYRLTRRRHGDHIDYVIRRRYYHPHHDQVEAPVVIRDRYATPGIVFDVSIGDRDGPRFDVGLGDGRGRVGFGERFEDDDRYEDNDRYEDGDRYEDDDRFDRNERPGNRDDRDQRDERPGNREGRDDRPGDRVPREYRGSDGVPNFETQRVERRDEREIRDRDVRFDLERGFTSGRGGRER
jgi:hypothetical protein